MESNDSYQFWALGATVIDEHNLNHHGFDPINNKDDTMIRMRTHKPYDEGGTRLKLKGLSLITKNSEEKEVLLSSRTQYCMVNKYLVILPHDSKEMLLVYLDPKLLDTQTQYY